MPAIIIVPFGGDYLALDVEQLHAARQRARDLLPPSSPSTPAPEPLLTAEQMAAALSVPQSQVEALARQRRIPSVLVGKYRRYDRAAVLAALDDSEAAAANVMWRKNRQASCTTIAPRPRRFARECGGNLVVAP